MLVSKRTARHYDSWIKNTGRFNWWTSATCLAYYNLSICGKEVESNGGGALTFLAQRLKGRSLGRGISIGCGAGKKEFALIQSRLVEQFELWEISPQSVAQGQSEAETLGIGEQINYHLGDAFSTTHEPYDLVFWDHSLHHMSDVVAAIQWSAKVVRPGGFVMIDDYIGPNRLQFPVRHVDRANRLLERHGVDKKVQRSSPMSLLKQWYKDPTEAPQSELILNAIILNLPDAEVRAIGGAMLNMLGPIVTPVVDDDHPLLRDLLKEDAAMKEDGVSHFVFSFWQRPFLIKEETLSG